MAIYRFVGDSADVYNPPFSFRRFGQKADLDDALAKHVVSQGVPLIPEAEFDAIGFTDDELAKFPSAVSQMKAPEDFQRRKKTALIALHEYRATLAAPPAPAPPPEPAPAPAATPSLASADAIAAAKLIASIEEKE